MRTKTVSTALPVATVVTLLVGLAFQLRVGATAEAIAVLQATGMTCDRCSSTITLALERESGVAVTAVDVAKSDYASMRRSRHPAGGNHSSRQV